MFKIDTKLLTLLDIFSKVANFAMNINVRQLQGRPLWSSANKTDKYVENSRSVKGPSL